MHTPISSSCLLPLRSLLPARFLLHDISDTRHADRKPDAIPEARPHDQANRCRRDSSQDLPSPADERGERASERDKDGRRARRIDKGGHTYGLCGGYIPVQRDYVRWEPLFCAGATLRRRRRRRRRLHRRGRITLLHAYTQRQRSTRTYTARLDRRADFDDLPLAGPERDPVLIRPAPPRKPPP